VIYHSYGPGYGFAFYNWSELISIFFGHLLTVVEKRMAKGGRQYHRRGKNRPCQAPSSRFITTRFNKPFFEKLFQTLAVYGKIKEKTASEQIDNHLYLSTLQITIVCFCTMAQFY